MPSRNSKYYSLLLIFADILTLVAAFVLAYIVRVQLDHRPLLEDVYAQEYLVSFILITPIWIGIFAALGLYSAGVYNRRLVEWSKILIGVFIGILLVIGCEYAIGTRLFPARLVALYAFGITAVMVTLVREFLRLMRSALFRYGVGVRRVLIVGNSAATTDIAATLSDTKKSGYEIVAIAGPKGVIPRHITQPIHYRSLTKALDDVTKLRISTIIQTDLYDSEERNQQIMACAQVHHIQYNFIPGEPEFYTGKNTIDIFLGYPIITVSQTPLIGWGAIVKNVFDFILGIIALILLSPLFITLIILQKIFNPGPVFYKSARLTQFSKPIKLYKFRSMRPEFGKKDAAEEFAEMGRPDLVKEYKKHHKVEHDPRVTKFGHFLRVTSLDELPQLLNVIQGELSLVGPRPILPQEVKFNKTRTALLHSVKSGVTGLWQVSGRSNLSFEERIELELYYARNWSFWLDIKILLKTIAVVFRRKGAK